MGSLRYVDALELFQLTFAQGFDFRGEAMFCFCALFRFSFRLAANCLQLSQLLHVLFALTTCLFFNLLLSFFARTKSGFRFFNALELFCFRLMQLLNFGTELLLSVGS